MKKSMTGIITLSIIFLLIFLVMYAIWDFAHGNKAIIDTAMRFDEAIISLPNGDIVKGKVEKWLDFNNSDQIQITISGKTYLVHSMNAVLIKN